jgi:hypothetical protein
MPLRILFARIVSLLLLLPAGLLCVGFPFARFALPGGWGIVDDTRAAFGAGTDGGKLKANYVDCVRERSGSNSSRGIGFTEYGCVIDLAEEQEKPPQPAPAQPATGDGKGGDPYAGLTDEEATARWNAAMAEHTRSINAGIEAMAAQRRARSDVSNRIERKLASNKSGDLPAVRILSAPGEPRRVGLFWGWGELAWRWASWLLISLLFFAFGGAALFAVYIAWKRR